ncbi:carbon-nitrogen hydrolase family protein [Georgenia satyanarayanai]|uniref:carbon-nitrogen hydrolase family protein n=1 Tax=Georgenia satyanarayanai TaxID=860221 RepID=UPI00203B6298|nr:carbon-nitrogen hydrolase family protein [Georgenia satyanarayanai]MCM3659755.1 carbon-nitrogen hydrolase family protein [Georgenia satyanarayanai]
MALTVAVAQFAPGQDKAANLRTIEEQLRTAASRGARLAVLPEFSVFTAPAMDERFVASAEPLDGPSVGRLRELSAELDLTVVAGVNEAADGERIHNALVGLQGGELRALYRKVHLYDAFGYRESDRVIAADPREAALLEVDGFTVGLQTCYDIRFPEVSRTLVDAGADVLAVPAAWAPGPLKEYHWGTLLRARAIENTVYVLGADQTGPTSVGNSVILDPMGVALAAAGEAPGVAVAQLGRTRLEQVRAVNPALRLRRFRVTPAEG